MNLKKIRKKVKLAVLTRHPFAASIYELNDIDKLAQNIDRIGIIQSVPIVDSNNYLLTGARVVEACRKLGWAEIEVDAISEISEDEAKEIIISGNHQRVKTVYEMTKEAEYYLSKELPKRQGQRTDKQEETKPEWAQNKERYQAVADKIGSKMSGHSLRKLLAVKKHDEEHPEADLKLMDKIESGDLSIDRATKLIDSYKSQQVELGEIKPIAPVVLDPNVERLWTLYNSSSLNMYELRDGMIQTVVISGPYWQQRKYGIGEQAAPELGLEATWEEYISNMVQYFKEIYRVLKDTGSFFLNIGDTYSKSDNNNIMLRLVLAACDECGFFLVNSIVWHKKNVLPQTAHRRLQPSYELIYHLVKDADKYDYYPLKYVDGKKKSKVYTIDRHNKNGSMDIGQPALSKPYKKFSDFIDAQKFTDVIVSSNASYESAELRKMEPRVEHCAIFPSTICLLPILTTSKPGQIVLDSFSGSGTTIDTAIMLGRRAIGYEIEERYVELTKKRLLAAEQKVNQSDMDYIQQKVELNNANIR